jgi:enamine deaminase RidA (YjgF/YER057c/UK114 family)
MGALNNAMGEVLGPAAGAVGMVQDGFADVTDTIADVKKKAGEAVAYAKNVEGKAKDLIDKLSSMEVVLDDWSDIDEVNDSANAFGDAVGADPFSDAATNPAGGGGASGAPFPQNCVKVGIGAKIDRAEQAKVEPDLKWEEARVERGEEKKDDTAKKEEAK